MKRGEGGTYIEQVITVNLSFSNSCLRSFLCVCLHGTHFIKLSIVIFCSCAFYFLVTVQLAQLIPSVSRMRMCTCLCNYVASLQNYCTYCIHVVYDIYIVVYYVESKIWTHVTIAMYVSLCNSNVSAHEKQ